MSSLLVGIFDSELSKNVVATAEVDTGPAHVTSLRRHVRFWHLRDIDLRAEHVCFEG